MIYNKKGGIDDPMTLFLIIFVVGLFSAALLYFSVDLVLSSSSNLDSQSVVRIAEQNGFKINDEWISNITTQEDMQQAFYSSSLNDTEDNIKDFAYEFLFYRQKSSSFVDKIQSLYSLPSYLVSNFGLDYNTWSWVINSFNFIIWCIILFAGTKFIRGILK